jgi:hypothetical protein
MRRNALLGACLAAALVTVGCQNQDIQPTDPSAATAQSTITLDHSNVKLPASARMSDRELVDFARRAVEPTTCSSSTEVLNWFRAELSETITQERAIYDLLIGYAADIVPTYEALVFQTRATPQFFGYTGEYSEIMVKTERDVKGFWDIKSDDIQLVAMHGTMLQEEPRVAATYASPLVFGLDAATARLLASQIHAAVSASKTLDGGNHPMFTFNAFAFSGPEFGIPDKIIMGDGILEGFKAVGLGDVAPQGIYAHEFGHHIQYERGYIDEPIPGQTRRTTEAEKTRYTELMADAFSAYFLTHSRGGALNRKRVEQFLQVFFQIGDCAFTDPGHHGTPLQRMAAAQFGFDVAAQAQKQGQILTAAQFHALFVAEYPEFID